MIFLSFSPEERGSQRRMAEGISFFFFPGFFLRAARQQPPGPFPLGRGKKPMTRFLLLFFPVLRRRPASQVVLFSVLFEEMPAIRFLNEAL